MAIFRHLIPLWIFLRLTIAVGVLASSAAAIESQAGAAFLEKLSLNAAPSQILIVCHGFGCAYRNELVLTPSKLSYLRGLLARAQSASEERRTVARIIAWYDREEGRVAGTINRIAYASAETKTGPSQMDCIDLTANITELLIVLNRAKLLRYHRVGEPESRGLIVDGRRPHTTAVIVEIADGSEWSVDSWTRSYGQSPEIMTISEWRRKDSSSLDGPATAGFSAQMTSRRRPHARVFTRREVHDPG